VTRSARRSRLVRRDYFELIARFVVTRYFCLVTRSGVRVRLGSDDRVQRKVCDDDDDDDDEVLRIAE